MPVENIKFYRSLICSHSRKIVRFVKVVSQAGIKRVRLTGGEPLVRSQIASLVEMLNAIDGIEDIALTTNGILLAKHAQDLKNAGLHRLNISLDTVDPVRFEQIARRKGLDAVLEGIRVAQSVGFDTIRINAVALAGITEQEIIPLAKYCLENGLELRFIEFMPLDAENKWDQPQVLSGGNYSANYRNSSRPSAAVPPMYPGQPAVDYKFADGSGRVGFINPVSQPFCGSCNRIRITAEGKTV